MDYFKELEKHMQLNENIFGKLFPKKDSSTTDSSEDTLFKTNVNGGFIFGEKSTAKEVNTPALIPFLKKFDWKNSKLNFLFLPGTEFHADYIEFDLEKQIIMNFKGTWVSGPFIGKNFEGIFKNTSFQGTFHGRYTDYEAHPISFVEGRFIDTTNNGLLGMPNTLTIDGQFNLLTIPVGHYLQFRSKNGISCYIKVLKRLDEVDSEFSFEILNGYKSTKSTVVNLPWNYFRQNWKKLIINPVNLKSVADFITIPQGDSIEEIYISSAPANFKTQANNSNPESFNPKQKYNFNLAALPYLNIKSMRGKNGKFQKPEVLFIFDSPEEYAQYNQIVQFIQSGILKQDIKNIAKAIKYGEVNGYAPFNYLSTIFNNNPGNNKFIIPGKSVSKKRMSEDSSFGNLKFNNPTVDRIQNQGHFGPSKGVISKPSSHTQPIEFSTQASMQRLNDFVKIFVENIVDTSGQSDKAVQELILNRLKTALGTDIIKSQDNADNQDSKGMGMSNDDIDSLPVQESIRKEIRIILKKHL